jgi:hypothetical protein
MYNSVTIGINTPTPIDLNDAIRHVESDAYLAAEKRLCEDEELFERGKKVD